MTREKKELLLKDLCARLPYHVIVNYNGANVDLTQYVRSIKLEKCKPYLRPMSRMTDEEKIFYEYHKEGHCFAEFAANLVDWLNAHHFDYRGLIGKGLALEAPNGMYN